MKRFYPLFLILLCFSGIGVQAQNVMNANDKDSVFTSTNHPAVPGFGTIVKWGHTKSLNYPGTGTTTFKSYYYNGMQFRIKFPHTYQQGVNDGKKYPIFVFLHGAGEGGNAWDNESQLIHGGQIFRDAVDNGSFDGFLFYYQSPNGYAQNYFGNISNIIDSLTKYNEGDKDRVIIDGLSSGGQSCWDYLANNPKYIASAPIISAARGEYIPFMPSYVHIPIWLFNGGKDTNPGPETAQALVDTFTHLGGNIKHTFYPNNGHNCWDNAWADPGFIPYMNAAHKANPLLYFGKSNFCPGETINAKMGITAGFFAYQWSRNTVVISGATANTYTANQLGTYAVRFQRTNGGAWSDWSHIPIVITGGAVSSTPDIQINGSMSKVLPAPDGSTTVPLIEPTGFVSYKWIRLPDSAVVSTTNAYNAAPGTYLAQITALNACSSTYSNPFTVIPANGTPSPDPASNLTAVALSQVAVQLNWSKNPHPNVNETGFEVYRGLAAGGPYKLVAIAPKDTVNYLDNGLVSSTSYYYIVRAINNNGASKVTNESFAKTAKDTIPPTAPTGLTVTATNTTSVSLSWNASTDFVGVINYDIYVNGAKAYTVDASQTSFTVYSLNDKQAYSFQVKARDAAGNNSPFSNQVSANAIAKGLIYNYYTGTFSALPKFNTLTPLLTGTSSNVSLTPATQSENYAFIWTGYLNIRVAGRYTLETSSDDGSALWLGPLNGNIAYNPNGTPLVNNDGLHGTQSKTASITLQKGLYPIAATFFQQGGGAAMQLFWSANTIGISRAQIPDSAFVESGAVTGALPAAPNATVATALSYNKIGLTWHDNSTTETGYEIYRATSQAGPFTIVTTAPAGATSFTDSTVAASTTYYYKIRAINLYGASAYDGVGSGAPYNYYNTGSLSVLPNFANLTPTFTGIQPNFSLGMETQTTNFAVQFNTVIKITTAGQYTFSTTSDDGSALYVNGTRVVNNDGLHGSTTVSGNITLAVGTYPITVGFFNQGGGYNLSANYSGPGVVNQVIPTSVLGTPLANATTLALPAASKAPFGTDAVTLSSSSIKLIWSDTSNDASSFQIYRSTGDGSNYRLLNTVTNTGGTSFNYVDSSLFDNVLYFYKVSAQNVGGTSPFSNYDSALTLLNNPVITTPIANFTMKYGTKDTIALNVTSPDNVPLALTITGQSGVPAFISLTDNGNGTGRLIFAPAAADSGAYNGLVLIATATNGGIVKDTFNLVVNSNNPPVLNPIPNTAYDAGTTDTLTLTASDLDGLAGLAWSSTSLPAFGTLVDNGNGTASLILKPGYTSQGTYTIGVQAQDAQGAVATQSFILTINKKSPNQRFLVNMVYSHNGPTPWNNMTGPKLSNLVSTDNVQTGVSVSLSNPSWWQPWYLGAQTGNNSGVYPDAVMNDYYYFGIFGGPDVVYDTISGLKPLSKYNFKFFASSIWDGVPDNGTTVYRIGAQADSVYTQNNTQRTANINGTMSDASGKIIVAMSKAPGTVIGYLNAWEFSYIYDDSTAPAKPTGLAAQIISGSGIKLTWNAIAYNAAAYNVYRTTDTTQPYTLLNPTANDANATSYVDSAIIGHTTYYYKVKAVNQYGDLGFTEVVSATTAARNPVISAIPASTSVKASATANISFSATDDPGDAVTVTSSLPAFASLQNLGSGNYNIVLAPLPGNIGSYNASVTATDSYGATVTTPFQIFVVESQVSSIFVHFGPDTAIMALPWNNFTGYPFANIALSNLKWADGTGSGITATLVDQWSNAPLPLGMNTGNNTGVYPDRVLQNALFENTTSARRVKLTGMDTSKTYNIAIVSSVNGGFPSSSTFQVGTQSQILNAAYNSNKTGQFNGLKPDATGSLTITMTKVAASTYGFFNAFVIQSYPNSLVIVSPNNAYAEPLFNSRTSLHIGWSDRSNNETGFQVMRATAPTGPFSVVGTVAAGLTDYTDVSLTADTRYYYQIRAIKGAVQSDVSNIATAVTPAYIVLEHLTWKFPTGFLPWNNTGVNPQAGDVYANLNNDKNNNTGWYYTMVKDFNGEYAAGMTSGNNSYIFPDSVMMSNYWVDHGQIATMKLSGLDISKKYRVGFEGSSTWNGDMTATMSINGRTVYLNTYMNTSKVAYIDSVNSNSTGEININFSATGTYGFIGSIVVMAYTDNGYGAGSGGVTSTVATGNFVQATAATFAPDANTTAAISGDDLKEFKAYPNPFRDGFSISFHQDLDGKKVDVEIYNTAGMQLFHKTGDVTHAGLNTLNIDMPSSSPTGFYMAIVKIDGKVSKVFKLIKTR